MKNIRILLSFYLLFILNCGLYFSSRPGAKEYYELNAVSGTDNTASIRKFSSYPIEKQIDIYLFANCCTEGGGSGIYLSIDGEKKIPNIVKRIETSSDIRDKVALIAVLFSINKECKCMKKHSEFIKSLEKQEENFSTENIPADDNFTESYRKYYSDYLKDIKVQP